MMMMMMLMIAQSRVLTPCATYYASRCFIAQLVEHRSGIAEVTGSNPVEALIFSGFFFPIA